MIKCKMENACPKGYEHCCLQCPEKDTCKDVCDGLEWIEDCDYAEMDETGKVMVMKKGAAAIIKAVTDLEVSKKKIEEQEKAMRVKLLEAMEKYGVEKFDNDLVKFTYVKPTTRTTVDGTKLKKELPDTYAKYTKTSKVSASVRIEVK